jgi:uncharacterized protein YkwD
MLSAFDIHAIESSCSYMDEDELCLAEPMIVSLSTAIRSPATRTIEEIVKQFLDFPYDLTSADTFSFEPGFTLPLSAGAVSNASLQNGLNSVNFVRFAAGLSPVTLNAELTNLAQHGSTLLAYIGEGLTHYPQQPGGVSNDFFNLAYRGAAESNLSAGRSSLATSVINGWMNSSTGHRFWVLHPPLREIGLGIAHNPSSVFRYYSAMHVLDNAFGAQPFDYVAWPAEVMPHHLYLQNRTFSITLFGYDSINANTLSINITSQKLEGTWSIERQQITTLPYSNHNAALFNTPVIFDADDVLTITVSGISKGGAATSITYKTEFFRMYPDKISDLQATRGDRSVTLSWTAPVSDTSGITHYEYRSRNTQTWSWGDWISLPGLETSHTIIELINGVSYAFQVRAVNAVGAAEASDTVESIPSTVPAAIMNLSATSGNRQVTLRWSIPNNGGLIITGHEMRQRAADGEWGDWISMPNSGDWFTWSPARSFLVDNLTNGTTYEFQIRAVNENGEAPDSNTITATPAIIPSQVTNFAATPGNRQVSLTWASPADNGGAEIIRYEVSVNSTFSWETASSNTEHIFTGLTNGIPYTFRVRAVNSAGAGDAASVVATPLASAINPNDPQQPDEQQWRPAQTFNPFIDVPNAPNWQNNAVSWAYRNNITTGTSDTTFSPDDPVTRAQFVTFLHRIFGRPSAPRATFSDMPGNIAFQNAISWASAEGITTGSPAGGPTFMPDDNITREQIAAMLYRYIGDGIPVMEDKLGGYTDQNRISTWAGARDAMNWAVHNGIIGVNTTTLNPGGNATRAEAVTMLYRVVEIFEISAP